MMALEFCFVVIILLSGKVCTSTKETVDFDRDGNGHNPVSFGGVLNVSEVTKTPISVTRSKRSSFTEDPCYNRALCKTQNELEVKTCYCDAHCLLYGDCCYDAILETGNNTNITNYANLSCVNYRGKQHPGEGFWMVNGCPAEYTNQFIVSQCESRELVINRLPVFDNHGIAFVNSYCAICNTIETYTMSMMNYEISYCVNNDHDRNPSSLTSVIPNCRWKKENFLAPQGFNFRRCLRTQMDSSNDICHKYQNLILVYADNKWHQMKNYFCAEEVNKSIEPVCKTFWHFTKYSIYSLVVLFRFTPPKIESDASQCLETEIYNSETVSNFF